MYEYVSIAKSRAGWSPAPDEAEVVESAPKTSVKLAAKTTHDGGKSASITEEG